MADHTGLVSIMYGSKQIVSILYSIFIFINRAADLWEWLWWWCVAGRVTALEGGDHGETGTHRL